ncbi:hypothetical protein AZI85_09275 [Bdellovibrio bacteriovorus]|uniref:CHRD domain-containing protein n=1 Tax=Bdellovibrio bacteriovorus TaxID=959 RepID=A0A150WDI7_BDEBC|nr:hypothetical protein [Bdellovibrio bacteriovorus]KYG61135.1 hypothetical protein AZI85_09275 [Bdellovibrio bacteriovorus]
MKSILVTLFSLFAISSAHAQTATSSAQAYGVGTFLISSVKLDESPTQVAVQITSLKTGTVVAELLLNVDRRVTLNLLSPEGEYLRGDLVLRQDNTFLGVSAYLINGIGVQPRNTIDGLIAYWKNTDPTPEPVPTF